MVVFAMFFFVVFLAAAGALVAAMIMRAVLLARKVANTGPDKRVPGRNLYGMLSMSSTR